MSDAARTLVVGVSGASCALTARLLLERSPWPVTLVVSRWGEQVYEHECGPVGELQERAKLVLDNDDLSAPVASGSLPTIGMVVMPCSSSTLAAVAAGLGDTLITRAAHCHLKERRPLILGVREAPWSLIDLDNARSVTAAGGVVMPISPPCFMSTAQSSAAVTLESLLEAYIDRVLALLGREPDQYWRGGHELVSCIRSSTDNPPALHNAGGVTPPRSRARLRLRRRALPALLIARRLIRRTSDEGH